MALIQGIHILAHGDRIEARKIAPDVEQNQRLLVGHNTAHGAGAYAWYKELIPGDLEDWPQVLFEIDDRRVVHVRLRSGASLGFFRIPGVIGDYVSIRVIALSNIT
jgi:hypothetical protein